MPPPDKKHDLGTRERVGFVAKLRKFLEEADMLVIEKRDRSPVRRITRDEFQHNLRDLLQMPTLDVKDKLPEDRRSHGFVKVAGLLDLSRVHLNAYLDAAEMALTEAVAPSVTATAPHKFKATGVNLFTGLTTFGGREAMFFVRENKMTPIRKEMKPEELADPTLLLAGGGFKHGQHLAFDSRNNTPLCRLFVSMLQNIGIETDSFSSGIGTLPGFVPA